MKHVREIKVGILAVVCAGILYFGFNFLKGVNIFSPTNCYYGYFERSNALTEQAPVYILGHQVGLVDSAPERVEKLQKTLKSRRKTVDKRHMPCYNRSRF